MRYILLPIAGYLFLVLSSPVYAQFTEVAASVNLDFDGKKDGGVAWADFNEDGFLDIIFNTDKDDKNHRSRIFFSDGSMPNPSFTDVTFTHADGISDTKCERSVSVGDFNNDGHIDFCRNTFPRFEVYLNKGPLATPAYSFGDANQDPDFVITAIPGGTNTEGFGWIDYNSDGYLDLIAENHEFGIDIYENPANGTANFVWVDNALTGLPTGGTTGDYMAICDYDNDGFVDLLARKQNEDDLWRNNGNGTFTTGNAPDIQTQNNNKGGVVFCDFDNDGDFDFYWTTSSGEEIYEQTGVSSGIFVPTGEPKISSGFTTSNKIDGCSCGDVDNDGDMDLFLGGEGNGNSHLFLNNGLNNFEFTQNNSGIEPNEDTEGTAFADYDNDGDLDLYINIDNDNNQLWRNATNNTNYLKVNVLRNVGTAASPILRDDLNATVVLKDCSGSGDIIGGIRQVSSVTGHGCNDPAVVHFGLPGGNNQAYLLEIRYTTLNGVRTIIDTVVTPSLLLNQTVSVIAPLGPGGFDGCPTVVLPVELVNFQASKMDRSVRLAWITVTETENDFFVIERSQDGQNWTDIGKVNGAGNSSQPISYFFDDNSPLFGQSYYRLRQTDFNGSVNYSDIRTVGFDGEVDLRIAPNPTNGMVKISGSSDELAQIYLQSITGQTVNLPSLIISKSENEIVLDLSNVASGIYFLKTNRKTYRLERI